MVEQRGRGYGDDGDGGQSFGVVDVKTLATAVPRTARSRARRSA